MPQRVTQGMMNTQLLTNLNSNLKRLDNLQNQLATGRQINKPSDDPVGISFSMRYRSEISSNEQYQKNADSASSWLDYSDTILNQAGDVIHRVRELAVQGANGTNPPEALDAINSEMKQLYGQLVQIGNSQFNGKYVFNGQTTDARPYTDATADKDFTDTGDIQFEVGVGSKLAVNITGDAVFGSPASPDNAFAVIKKIMDNLSSGNYQGVSDSIGLLDSRTDIFLEKRADIGAKQNRIDLTTNRLKDTGVNITSLLSKTEDADMAKVITQLKTDENVYEASLSTGSKIIRPSLLDFLK
ncbi:flagellar hook-associated protein FlgL [Paenibacillus andongensis]|uniref:flagellar hook-associated protein FlgL n=1 Tax=Paenibacillus andongensis TaxID=2975482 RepID=UPI0021BAA3B3|nr:flagellar hook-associated protein FlgL [Paenibacillus andongensis]